MVCVFTVVFYFISDNSFCVPGKSVKEPLQELVEKYIIKLTKVLLAILEHHPLSFVEYLPTTLRFTVHYAFTVEGEELLFERFLIQCLNLLKGILLCPEYKPAKIIQGKCLFSCVIHYYCVCLSVCLSMFVCDVSTTAIQCHVVM